MLRSFIAILALAPLLHADNVVLNLRTRTETEPKSERYHVTTMHSAWDGAKTAVILCDLWDAHGCPSAAARVNELAPQVNEFIKAARKHGMLIIHCPSDCMKFYEGTQQRKLAMSAPKTEPKVPLERWCKLDAAKEGKLPIDDSDGGCAEALTGKNPWTRQHAAIEIQDGDAVTDSEEAYYLLRQRGITNVLICGVHTNMCVLGRPFGIRQLVKQGLNVVLVRDLTDTMYNPAREPFVSHFTGTDLVVEHIEKHWCPTVLRTDLVGGKEFRFKADTRPTITMLIGEDEYKTETSLPAFALKHLGQDFRVRFVFADAKDKTNMIGLEQLNDTDLMLLSMRRRPLKTEQLNAIRKYFASGRPLVAIRTASHSFAPMKGAKTPAGISEWPTFDTDILGCHYTGHVANTKGTKIEMKGEHPILAGFKGYQSNSGVYKSSPLEPDCVVLLTGTSGDVTEPVAWVREKSEKRGRVFYAALGHVDDFATEAYPKMLANACRWAVSANERATKKGTITGVVTAKDADGKWIEVKADGEEKARRYVPHWKGGQPKDGGGLDKEMRAKIQDVALESRVTLDWEFAERARVIKIEVLKKK